MPALGASRVLFGAGGGGLSLARRVVAGLKVANRRGRLPPLLQRLDLHAQLPGEKLQGSPRRRRSTTSRFLAAVHRWPRANGLAAPPHFTPYLATIQPLSSSGPPGPLIISQSRVQENRSHLMPLLGEVSPTSSQEAVGAGATLSRDITVSCECKLNPLQGEDVNQIRLGYKIQNYFSAETQLGRQNTGGDLVFNIDF